jgi:NTP pyrophosphatase (non-canonical NTP hydrolase)
MSQLKQLTDLLVKFRDQRDWKQFHNPKDLAIAISIESSELLEAFLWKNSDVVSKEKIEEEVADVMAYLLLIAAHYELDLEKVLREKVKKNELKYPIEKAKGNATKYNEL